jgi:hypothetical protein
MYTFFHTHTKYTHTNAHFLDPRSAVCRAALRIPCAASTNAYGLGGEGGGGVQTGHVQGLGWSAAASVEEEEVWLIWAFCVLA